MRGHFRERGGIERVYYGTSDRGSVRMAKKGNVLQQLGSLIGLELIIVVITALNPAFIEIPNLFNILRQVSINTLIAF